MSYAVLFTGQASQHVGMLPWLESSPRAAVALRAMELRTGAQWRTRLQDPVDRSNNAFAQCLVTGTSLAAWQTLRALLSQGPAVVAGYSVGELAAFCAAGIYDAGTALVLAAMRAHWMDQAAAQGPAGGLLSVSGMAPAKVMSYCSALQCAIWIDNDQAIFGADNVALEQAALRLATYGALCKRLDIEVASHTAAMEPAAIGFANVLAQQVWKVAACTVVTNASGIGSRKPEALRTALAQQISHTVQWAACMDAVRERGVHCVIEIGAGHALSDRWNRRHPGIPARSLEDFKDPQGAASWILERV